MPVPYANLRAFQPLVGAIGDLLEVWRAERRVRLAEGYQAFLRRRGLSAPTREVTPAFLLPLLERASIEADDDL
jgi:hypothetical protein